MSDEPKTKRERPLAQPIKDMTDALDTLTDRVEFLAVLIAGMRKDLVAPKPGVIRRILTRWL